MRFSLVKAVPPASSMPAARVPNSLILETSTCAMAAGAAPARAWITISRSCLTRSPSGSTSCTTTKNLSRSQPIMKDQRISGALRVEPAFLNKGGNHTVFKANFESGQVDSDNPRALPPTDHITPFFTPADTGAYQAGLNGLNSWVSGLPASYVASAANGYAGAGRAGNSNDDPWFTNAQVGNSSFPLNVIQNGSTVGSAGTYRFTSLPQPGLATTTGLTLSPMARFPAHGFILTAHRRNQSMRGCLTPTLASSRIPR